MQGLTQTHLRLVVGGAADILTFAGSVTLAVDAFLRRKELREIRSDAKLLELDQRLKLWDRESAGAEVSFRRAILGSSLLSFGFLLQLYLRLSE